MQLPPDRIDDYARLLADEQSTVTSAAQAAALREAIARGERALADLRVVTSADGQLLAAVELVPIGPGAFALTTPRVAPECSDPALAAIALVTEACARARARGAQRLAIRVVEDEAGVIAAGLATLGFTRREQRHEFRTPVTALPPEGDSPMTWRPLPATDERHLADASALLARCVRGDPDWDPDDDPQETLASFLADRALYCEPDCLHLASRAGTPVGLVIAQSCPGTGWSRLTYLGLVPEARGLGLGGWLHRHGFAMLRAQGAALYVGGTSVDNAPMLALFRRHGCGYHRTVTEWQATLLP